MFDFYRVATAVPDLKVADVEYNLIKIKEMIIESNSEMVNFVVFPELSLTGYTCGDLFFQSTLINESNKAIVDLENFSKDIATVFIIGAPININGQLYNSAISFYNGKIIGINIKTFLPNYNEFYEKRWFSSAVDLTDKELCSSTFGIPNSYLIPIGNDFIINFNNEIKIGIEICEDLWSPLPPSTFMSLHGAQLIFNLSASNELISKKEYRRNLVKTHSATTLSTYVYCSAGSNESTTDLIFSGNSIISENGSIIKENVNFIDNNYLLISDIDIGKINADRIKGKTFKDVNTYYGNSSIRTINIANNNKYSSDGSKYFISKLPFIPSDKNKRLTRCTEIFEMQVGGLCKRLNTVGGKLIVGVSGGMDSTLALLVSAKTIQKSNKPMSDLIGITMPAFGTTDRTYNNSLLLMKTLGITIKEINIKESCLLHMRDIDHDENIKDITYENIQARERTKVLMDYANKVNGIVVGTGDLSELALGWCTYNADQMSMYGVNASIPKTLVKWMIDSVIKNNIFPDSTNVLKDIIDTPISPELLPPDKDGEISQKTEEVVGPYQLHDFFLYYMMRFGFSPNKIFYLASKVFNNEYSQSTILKWMNVFYKRFFTQQFKRSCMPDGVKVGSICLSPRGDWRMPSDASYYLWLHELQNLDLL